MGWCPKCKEEYESFVTVCSECNEDLVQSLDEVEDEPNIKYIDDIVLKELVTVDSLIEAERLINLLESYDIYATYKQKGAGEYLQIATGINYRGVTLYVNNDDYTKALNIVREDEGEADSIPYDIDVEEAKELEVKEKKFKSRRRSFFILLIILTILFPMVMIISDFIFTKFFL